MRFSDFISKSEYSKIGHDKSGWRYSVKFENSGRRTIIDLEVVARLSIPNLVPNKKRTHVFLVPLNPDGNLSFRWPESLPLGKTDKSRHLSRFYINSAVEHLDRPPYPDNIRKKARLGTLTLEELLGLDQEAKLKVYAFGYDKFSGTRKLFVSHPYGIEDIKKGSFSEDGMDIVPDPDDKSTNGKNTVRKAPRNAKLTSKIISRKR